MKVIIISFNENEDHIFQQTLEWLSEKSSYVPVIMAEKKYDFSIDQYIRTFIYSAGHKVYLTAKEFDLFYLLFSHKGQVFTKEQLYENVWGYDYVPDAKNLSLFIRRLRKKVEPDPNKPKYIITVWGVGYKFTENP